MAYSRYYGTQNQALGQQYNDDETSQLFFTGNLHHRQSQNQNDEVADGWGDFNTSQHQQKLYDIRNANRIDGDHSGLGKQNQSYPPTMPQQNLNLEPTFNNRSGFVQGHPTPQWSFNPQSSERLRLRCPEGPYLDLGSNQFAHQLPGHQHGEPMMHQQFGEPNRPVDFRLHYSQEEQFHNNGQVQHQQYLPHTRQDQYNLQQHSGNNFVPDAHNQRIPEVQNPEIHVSHIHLHYVSGNTTGFGSHQDQQNVFDGSTQDNLGNPEKPIYLNLGRFNPQQSFGNNDPLEIGSPQQMKESPRTQQLIVQMEQHTIQSLEPVHFQNNNSMELDPQQLTHMQFQDAQNLLLETDKEPGNNEGDDQWRLMAAVVDANHYRSTEAGRVPGNNENDESEWMELDTPDCNNEFPTPSTDSTASVNFFMDNNGVPLPLGRVKKPKAPRGSIIPKVLTSRQTSLKNIKRRESNLQLSPAAKPPREFKERFRPKENTLKRENNREYSKTYRDNQKELLKMAEEAEYEALEQVKELQETTLEKEKNAKFAIKLLKIMGKAPERDDEEKRYEEKKQKKIKKSEDLKEKDDDINEAKEAKSEAEENLKAVSVLVAAKQANASKKTRAKQDLELKAHLYAKLIYDFDYKRELELQRLVHILLRHTCRPFLDPLFRYELEKKMQEHGIQDQLPDFIAFIDSHSSFFKPPTEQEDKIK